MASRGERPNRTKHSSSKARFPCRPSVPTVKRMPERKAVGKRFSMFARARRTPSSCGGLAASRLPWASPRPRRAARRGRGHQSCQQPRDYARRAAAWSRAPSSLSTRHISPASKSISFLQGPRISLCRRTASYASHHVDSRTDAITPTAISGTPETYGRGGGVPGPTAHFRKFQTTFFAQFFLFTVTRISPL